MKRAVCCILAAALCAVTLFCTGCSTNPTLESLELTKFSSRGYYVGDAIDTEYTYGNEKWTNIPQITAVYSDGFVKALKYGDEGLSLDGFDSSTPGEKSIMVTFKDKGSSISTGYSVTVCEKADPAIQTQPTSSDVRYPEGVKFAVAASAPCMIAGYRWQMYSSPVDESITEFDESGWTDLTGYTAKTDTLSIVSTEPSVSGRYFRCTVTDVSGKSVTSDVVKYVITNRDEKVPCFYAGEYAICAGSSFDLSRTEYGTGIISVNETGDTVTLDGVDFTNGSYSAGKELLPAAGIFVNTSSEMHKTVTVKLIGKNVINNNFRPDGDGASIPILVDAFDGATSSDLVITGDGVLEINGASEFIYSKANVTVDADVTINRTDDLYSAGINCFGFTLNEGKALSANLTASVITANSITVEKGASVKAYIKPASVGETFNTENIFDATDFIYIKEEAEVDVDICASGAMFGENRGIAQMSVFSADFDGIYVEDAKVDVSITSTEGRKDFAKNITAIFADKIRISGSEVTVCADAPDVTNITGLAGKDVLVSEGSIVDIDVAASGNVYGAQVNTHFFPEESKLSDEITPAFGSKALSADATAFEISNSMFIVCSSVSEGKEGQCFGVLCYDYKLSGGEGLYVGIETDEGIALGVFLGTGSEECKAEDGYTARHIKPTEGTSLSYPEKFEINKTGIDQSGSGYVYVETVYDMTSMKKPAQAIEITNN